MDELLGALRKMKNGKAGDSSGIVGEMLKHLRAISEDMHVETPVPFSTAALGGSVRVPTLDGDISMKVTPGTQPGAQPGRSVGGA